MMEQWRIIADAPRYEISSQGVVRRASDARVLKSTLDRYGYPRLVLVNAHGEHITRTIHRLVATAFIPNPNGLPQVNHKNGVKTDSCVNNLEWITAKDNIIHAITHGLTNSAWSSQLTDVKTGKILGFRSVKQLAKHLGVCLNVLIPYIRTSRSHPFKGRYVIDLDETSIDAVSNVGTFGMPHYVYDYVNKQHVRYESGNLAAFYTGIRGISNLSGDAVSICAGYCVSRNRYAYLEHLGDLDEHTALSTRNTYLACQYRSVSDIVYHVYDYHSCVIHAFDTLDEVLAFVNTNRLNITRPATKSQISYAISDSSARGRSGLIRGFGLKSSVGNTDWTSWPEENILCSRHNKPYLTKVYRVTMDGAEVYAFGDAELAKLLPNHNLWGRSGDSNKKRITQSTIDAVNDDPHIVIDRLTNPMKVKIKI